MPFDFLETYISVVSRKLSGLGNGYGIDLYAAIYTFDRSGIGRLNGLRALVALQKNTHICPGQQLLKSQLPMAVCGFPLLQATALRPGGKEIELKRRVTLRKWG